MIKKIIIPLILNITITTYSQTNLIANPSFELYEYCPDVITNYTYEFNMILGDTWKAQVYEDVLNPTATNTPDYYHTCGSSLVGVPENALGNQQAQHGNAYVGLYSGAALNQPFRSEFLIQELDSPLEAGVVYRFSMYVSLADTQTYATSGLGAAFVSELPVTDDYLTSDMVVGHITPQVIANGVIFDKVNWTKIEGDFTAIGNEQFVLIGSFLPLNSIKVQAVEAGEIYTPGQIFSSYYYVDNVSLTTSASMSSFLSEKITVYPNPAFDEIHIEGIEVEEIKSISVYDISSKKIFSIANSSIINVSDLSAGVFYLVIETIDDKSINKKFVKK